MTVLIDTNSTTTLDILTDELHIIAPNAVIAVYSDVGVVFTSGSSTTPVSGRLIVGGTVSSEGSIAILGNGLDDVTISQTGQVFGIGAGGRGMLLAGSGGNSATVAGTVYGDFASVVFASAQNPASNLTITSTGVVQGGSGAGRTDAISGALFVTGSADSPAGQGRVINHGLIHADANELDGARSAVINGDVSSTGFRGFDDVSENVLILTNTGTIFGDILALAGDDVVLNSGLIDGNVYLGSDQDYYNGSQGGRVTGAIFGEAGADVIEGGADRDLIDGGTEDDLIFGLGGSDLLFGASGEDEIRGGGGNDQMFGGSNGDELYGGSGNDEIYGDSGTDLIFGDSGDDTIFGGSSLDTINGGSGDDVIEGGSSSDLISGGSGEDFLRGDSASDTLGGGAGDDTMSGGTGDDSMDGGSGNDRMFGGSNNDTIEGTLGDDFLDGGSGDDSMSGGSDNDTLTGGTGQDTMSGGWGADVFDFNAISESASGSATRDTITDFETGSDMIDLSDISSSLTFVNTFSGVAGEVRYNDAVGRLYIDIDGDMASDLQIDLGAGAGLTADDLIL